MKEYLHPPLREYRGQKLRHAFCHRATFSRICVKAELTFDPYILLMEGILYASEKSQNSNTIVIIDER
ncbi:MAG: hypothetical protein OXB86_01655 [Bdellovibrionales bacterium]|nr:hypothetical protein [Bdellovibrionales bacterium]